MTLFKKVGMLTDIHFGEHLDSPQHNQDCNDFIDWFISRVRHHECDTIIFGGDWFHNKIRLEGNTGHHSESAIRKLSNLGLPIYWIIGNHDIYYKEHRTVHNLPWIDRYPNI